jgi:hypothetical protein
LSNKEDLSLALSHFALKTNKIRGGGIEERLLVVKMRVWKASNFIEK